ncbi:MAG: sialidase family protein [Planctomycetota bacterium]|jgi:hypothetical protein
MDFKACNIYQDLEPFVAIDNKGLWPNLTLLPSGEIAAVIYNHPSHGMGPDSGIELWISSDQGKSFEMRSLISDVSDVPGGIRMNHSAGLSENNELIVLVSGFNAKQQLPLLPLQCCISADNGTTWQRHSLDVEKIPFGNILQGDDDELLSPMYWGEVNDGVKKFSSHLYASSDNGHSWQEKSVITEDANETFVHKLADGRLIASARTSCVDIMDSALPHGSGEKIFFSSDNGKTWDNGRLVSPQGQENSNILQLKDGRILHCITSRIPGLFGVVFRVSEDSGETWSVHQPLVTIPATDWHKTDCGYPSSVELDDGTIVTAYYFGPRRPEFTDHTTPWHTNYHMGILRWRP